MGHTSKLVNKVLESSTEKTLIDARCALHEKLSTGLQDQVIPEKMILKWEKESA